LHGRPRKVHVLTVDATPKGGLYGEVNIKEERFGKAIDKEGKASQELLIQGTGSRQKIRHQAAEKG